MQISDPPIIFLQETSSTNSELKRLNKNEKLEEGTTLVTSHQTSGRGQVDTSWESEPFMNLTFSILIYPTDIPANQQFIISQITALAILEVLKEETGFISIKWPNDIYYLDEKICGILIENEIMGTHISSSVIGIGLNVNQLIFKSNAPNPVSLRQITGKEYDLEVLLKKIIRRLLSLYDSIKTGGKEEIISLYKKNLFHGDGFYAFADKNEEFIAKIEDVKPDGQLVLETIQGETRIYAFKEIKYVL